MKRWITTVLAVVVIGATAWAVSEKTDPDGSAYPRWFKAGLYIGPTNINNPTVSTVNKITASTADFQSWDFPVITGRGTGAAGLSTDCLFSASFTKVGLKFGDVCETGIDQTRVSDWLEIKPLVTASNTYKLRACLIGISDAGTADQPDSGYTTRCFANTVR